MSSGTKVLFILLIHNLSILMLIIPCLLSPHYSEVKGVKEKPLLERLCLFIWETKFASGDFPLYLTSQNKTHAIHRPTKGQAK